MLIQRKVLYIAILSPSHMYFEILCCAVVEQIHFFMVPFLSFIIPYAVF